MTRAALVLALGGLCGCPWAGQETAVACSDAAHLKLMTWCASAAMLCREQGGSEEDCGTVCDPQAAEWVERCQN